MAYCKETKIIISADYLGKVVITSEVQCKLKEVGYGRHTGTHIVPNGEVVKFRIC